METEKAYLSQIRTTTLLRELPEGSNRTGDLEKY